MTDWLKTRTAPLWLGALLPLAAVALGLLIGDDPAEQAKLAARWTARAGVPLFLCTYLASTLLRRWPGAFTRAVMRYRRQWGLGFALSHTVHLVALGINITVFAPRTLSSLVPGAIAYAMLYIMAITSTNEWQRRLGPWWKRIHRFGVHYLWLLFTLSYALRAFGNEPDKVGEGVFFGLIMVAALALRLWPRSRPSP